LLREGNFIPKGFEEAYKTTNSIMGDNEELRMRTNKYRKNKASPIIHTIGL
jgi:hypothetical protein